jgi:hypothetical protein
MELIDTVRILLNKVIEMNAKGADSVAWGSVDVVACDVVLAATPLAWSQTPAAPALSRPTLWITFESMIWWWLT